MNSKLYAGTIVASIRVTDTHTQVCYAPAIVFAATPELARDYALDAAREKFSVANGYTAHDTELMPVSDNLVAIAYMDIVESKVNHE